MKDIDGWITISERKKDFWIGGLFGYWSIINFGMIIIIRFFVNQQESIPFNKDGLIGLFPYIFIWLPGIYIVVSLLNRCLPIWMEMVFIFLMFILSFSFSGQTCRYIEHWIRISELKALCYQTVSVLYNSSQLCLILIWYLVRFKKKTPFNINRKLFVTFFFVFIIIGIFADLIYYILKAVHLFPYIM